MITHTVQQGDTLWKISKAYGISLESLIAANPQIANPDHIDVGMQVMVPKGGATMPEPGVAPVPAPAPATIPAPTALPIAQQQLPPATPPVGAAHLDPASHTYTTGPIASEAPTAPASIAGPPLPEPAYPSVPKWEGLWKYVVKNGDSLFKIAKQVGVTLDQLKAANPQVPNPDKIYPGQVLNIPSSGLKKSGNPGNPGYSLKEQMTAPMGVSPLSPKELLTQPKQIPIQPKEMAPVETPISAPMPMPAMPHPFEINANLNFAPHKEVNKETNTQIGNFAHHNQYQQAQAVSPGGGSTVAKQEMDPAWHHHMMQYYAHMAPMMHMYYVPVKMKKKHHKCGCHKHHKCGCKHKHHHAHLAAYHQHLMMMQHMGTMPKTFYREED